MQKKILGGVVAGCLAVGFVASVHAAVSGATPGTVTIFQGSGGGAAYPPVTYYGNCSAVLQQWQRRLDGYGADYSKPVLNWMTVAASSPAACQALVAQWVGDPNTYWETSPYYQACSCSEPGIGRALELGGAVNWTHEKDTALKAELLQLKEQYRIDEYYSRVEAAVQAHVR